MPLVMPFYFDYDLLLLAIPAALCAIQWKATGSDRLILPAWSLLYLCLIINPDVAERTHVNVAVPILCVLAGSLTARALRRDAENGQYTSDSNADALTQVEPAIKAAA